MKKRLSFLLFAFAVIIKSQTFTTVPILQNGDNSKRINVVILGDGYLATEQNKFITDAQAVVNYLISKSPYSAYKNYFNFYAVKVVSLESGIKHPGTGSDVTEPVIPVVNPNNYLSSSFDVGGTHRCIYGNNSKVSQVLVANVPDYDIALIIANSSEYGGCGGQFAFFSAHTLAPDIALHELGHSFGLLADEYWFAPTGERPNKTQNSNSATIKWKNWVGTSSVGIYPYTESPTWFRPHQNCEMRYLNQAFCRVCRETLIERIHSFQGPIDSFTPANTSTLTASASMNFTVNLILPIPNTLNSSWKLNNISVGANLPTLTVTSAQLQNGNNQLLYTVVDDTSDVLTDNHSTLHFSTVAWTINKSSLGVQDVKGNEYSFVLYPNPTKDYVILESKSENLGDISVQIFDASGRLVSNQNFTNQDKYKIEMSDWNEGTYIVNVYKSKSLILSQKISKN